MANPWDNDPEVGGTAVANPWDSDPEVAQSAPGSVPSILDRYLDAQIRPVKGAAEGIGSAISGLPGILAAGAKGLTDATPFDNLTVAQGQQKQADLEQQLREASEEAGRRPPSAGLLNEDEMHRQDVATQLADLKRSFAPKSDSFLASALGAAADQGRQYQQNATANFQPVIDAIPTNPALDNALTSKIPEELGKGGTLLAGGGLFGTAAIAASQAQGDAFAQTLKATGDQAQAEAAGQTAFNRAMAMLPVYMAGGAAANAIPLRAAAGPLETALTRGALSTGANMGASALGRSMAGENPGNVLESLPMDFGFGAHTAAEAFKHANSFPIPADQAAKLDALKQALAPAAPEAPAPVAPQEAAAPTQPDTRAAFPGLPTEGADQAFKDYAQKQADIKQAFSPEVPINGPTVPESPATINAQMEQLANGQRPAVMIPGFGEVPKRPEGMRQVTTENGTFIFDPKQIDAATIRQLDAAGRQNEILGLGPESKQDVAATGGTPVAVTERTPEGTEVKAAVASEGQAPKTAQELEQSKTPGNRIDIETPEQVLSGREAATDQSRARPVEGEPGATRADFNSDQDRAGQGAGPRDVSDLASARGNGGSETTAQGYPELGRLTDRQLAKFGGDAFDRGDHRAIALASMEAMRRQVEGSQGELARHRRDTGQPELLQAMIESGGLRSKSTDVSRGELDFAHEDNAAARRWGLFKKDGLTMDEMAEALREKGFRVPDEKALTELLQDRLGGKKIYGEHENAGLHEQQRNEFSSRDRGESGSVAMPHVEAVVDFGRRVYKAGMDFATWAKEMVAHLGENVRKYLRDAWQRIKGDVGGGILNPFGHAEAEKSAIGEPALHKIEAYHGTPHEVDRFSSEKIGTGEGHQAYGHGLYFAGNKRIAEHYRDALANQHQGNRSVQYERVKHLQALVDRYPERPGTRATLEDAKQELARMGGPPTANLYRVEMTAHPDHLLDYDKTIAQQSPYVREKLKAEGHNVEPGEPGANRTGQQLYEEMVRAYGEGKTKHSSAELASEELHGLGIPGIKYLDASSRGSREGDTHNYVMFDDSRIKITHENDVPFEEARKKLANRLLSSETGSVGGGRGKSREERFAEGQAIKERAMANQAPLKAEDIKAAVGKLPDLKFASVESKSAIKNVAETIGQMGHEVKAFLAPGSASPEARNAALIMRESGSALAHRAELARVQFEKMAKEFDKLKPSESLAVMDAIEKGSASAIPGLESFVKPMREAFASRINEVRALKPGALEIVKENYFPHIWKDPAMAAGLYRDSITGKTMEGGKAFLKKRVIPTTAEGVALGLEPITWNPVDLMRLKFHEMDRFIMAQKAMNVMKGQDLVKLIQKNADIPPGWQPINDKISKLQRPVELKNGETEFVSAGQYYAPADAARVVNNYLSPGLRGNAIFDTLRKVGNTMNAAQLGLSAFHAGFVTVDTITSRTALGIYQMGKTAPDLMRQGEYGAGLKKALQGAGNVAQGIGTGPLNVIRALLRGRQILGEYRQPGYAAGDIPEILSALKAGGARFTVDAFYHNQAWKDFTQSVRAGDYGKGLVRMVPAVAEKTMAWLQEYAVPRIKAGVAADMIRNELDALPKDATRQQLRDISAKVWDSVDNRLGQLSYDNLFWHKTLKDVMLLTQRSVGWNLGTIRELGGGAVDLTKALGGNNPITHRSAYLMALPVTVGIMGAVYQYMHTGKGPDELKDLIAPKTGRMSADGSPERIMLPSYLKDIHSYLTHPIDTVTNKLHPLFSSIGQAIKNKDFYGVQVRDKNAPALTQAGQVAKFAAKQFVPFSITAAGRRVSAPDEIEPKAESFFGLQPAPADVRRSTAQNMMSDYFRDTLGERGPVSQEASDAKKMQTETTDALRRGWPLNDAQQTYLNGLEEKARNKIQQAAGTDPRVMLFQRMPYTLRPKIYQQSTPEEQKLFAPYVNRKGR